VSNRVEFGMRMGRALIIALIAIFSSALAFGCSCSNGPPIQKASESYRERAVFTARVVQLMGRTNNWNGARYSGQVLAVVHERYWGLPWYWPKVVLLDGGLFCNIDMADGEEYLVSGRRVRYGVVDVSGCSRTQPLRTAQLDLRTLDGSHCAAPGGTVIGHVLRGNDRLQINPPASNVPVNLRNQDGKTYTAQSDSEGIYELRHLRAGPYTVESRISESKYASSSGTSVVEGACIETPILLRDYDIQGQLMPGLDRYASVKLIGVGAQAEERRSGSIEPDGRFYFRNVPDGEYLLSLTTWVGAGSDFYYPGTFDRQKAARLRVSNHVFGRSLDFNPDLLPLVPIPVALDPPSDSGRFTWRVQLLKSNYIISEENWTAGGLVRPFGVPGASYEIGLYGYSNRPTDYGDCKSQLTPVTASLGLSPIHIAVPAACR
jgi:hypothetical protein